MVGEQKRGRKVRREGERAALPQRHREHGENPHRDRTRETIELYKTDFEKT